MNIEELTNSEQDALVDFLFTDAYKAIIKELKNYVERQDAQLLTFRYKPGMEEETLFRKVRSQTSREFCNSFVRILEEKKEKILKEKRGVL